MAESKNIWVTTNGWCETGPWVDKWLNQLEKYQKPTVKDTLDALLYSHKYLTHAEIEEEAVRYAKNDVITTKGLYDALHKEKEKKEMEKKTNIIWRADAVELTTAGGITARLVGIPKMGRTGNSAFDIRMDLQRILDGGGLGFEPKVKKVIFNNPATIIIWSDGTKTVVKRQKGDRWDPEKGFAMAYLKKLLGGDNTFNKEIKKWVKED